MKRLTLAVALVLTLVVLVSCKGKSSGDLFPLTSGNSWWYLTTDSVVVTGGGHDTTVMHIDSTQLTIPGTATVQGQDAWIFLIQTSRFADTLYLVEQTDQILQYLTTDDTAPYTFLKIPLAANVTWTSGFDPSMGYTTTTVKNQETVIVPAGTYAGSWRLEEKSDSSPTTPTYTWIAEDIGMVKMKRVSIETESTETRTHTMVMQLQRYTLH